MSEHVEKAKSFKVELSKPLLEEARCIPSLEKAEDAIIPRHCLPTLLFQLIPNFNFYSTFKA